MKRQGFNARKRDTTVKRKTKMMKEETQVCNFLRIELIMVLLKLN